MPVHPPAWVRSALEFFTLKKTCICKESYCISVQNNTLQSKQIFVFLVRTSSYVHHSRDLVPQGARRYSDSRILRVHCVGVYVYIILGQGESVVENCTWKVLATLTHAEHSSFLFMLLVGVCELLHSVSFCCPRYLGHRRTESGISKLCSCDPNVTSSFCFKACVIDLLLNRTTAPISVRSFGMYRCAINPSHFPQSPNSICVWTLLPFPTRVSSGFRKAIDIYPSGIICHPICIQGVTGGMDQTSGGCS
jgi:hypothetical protein